MLEGEITIVLEGKITHEDNMRKMGVLGIEEKLSDGQLSDGQLSDGH